MERENPPPHWRQPHGIPWPMLRNSRGRPDAMLTLCVVASCIVFICMLFGGSELLWQGLHLRIPVAGGESVIAVLTFVAGYVVRRKGDPADPEVPR